MSARHQEDAKRLRADFLLTDLDTALTLLETAAVSREPATIRHARQKAQRACTTVSRLLEEGRLSVGQRQEVAKKLAVVRDRLKRLGYEC